jgi:hypothetical protein
MKTQHFKINDSTLFVYKQKKASIGVTETLQTDPTTTMMTMTYTGFSPARSK